MWPHAADHDTASLEGTAWCLLFTSAQQVVLHTAVTPTDLCLVNVHYVDHNDMYQKYHTPMVAACAESTFDNQPAAQSAGTHCVPGGPVDRCVLALLDLHLLRLAEGTCRPGDFV